ncbi:hypothetical protein V6N11_070559 [Hibiscus sabdariffa]|uniref:Uncharacterized protein n=1 Tax=Hibiscus sabdariffa TaxID=183260 RepID=A0ABR2QFV4_9ROSI
MDSGLWVPPRMNSDRSVPLQWLVVSPVFFSHFTDGMTSLGFVAEEPGRRLLCWMSKQPQQRRKEPAADIRVLIVQHSFRKVIRVLIIFKQQQAPVTVSPSGYAANDASSLINKVALGRSSSSSHSQTPWIEAPSIHKPITNNYNHRAPLYHAEHATANHGNTTDDSSEASDKNTGSRRTIAPSQSRCCFL